MRVVEKPKNFKMAIKRLTEYMKEYSFLLVLAIVFAVLSVIALVLGPNQINVITKEITKGAELGVMDMPQVHKLCLILLSLYLGSCILHVIQEIILSGISQKVTKKLRTSIDKKINKLPLSYYDNTTYGDVLSRVTNDVDTIGQSLSNSLAILVRQCIFLIGSIVMMFATNVVLATSAIGSTMFGVVFIAIILKISQKHFRRQQKNLGAINGRIEEVYSGHNIVKVHNGTAEEIKKFDEINERLYASAWKSQFLSGLMQPVMGFVGNFGYVVVCVVGGMMALDGKIDLGDIVAFLIYVRQFINPLSQIAQSINSFQSMAAAGERVFEFLGEKDMTPDQPKTYLDSVKGDVKFEHVRFGYNKDKIIIKDFCADVKSGQKVAIVGPTGAGKTTLVNLLMRFYELNDGTISIDGVPLTDLTRENIHDLFGMVLQDTWIFEGTIIDNVKYSKTEATEEDVVNACKAVGLHHYIKTLPNGYHTQLNEKSGLSAGQKQLLTIARAIVEDAPMLILDEATSNVDTRTEVIIQQAMDVLTQKRTSFIIAHRLSTIKNADIIFVLKDGDIIEQGNHQELLDKNGFYAELYNSQFQK
ncbi:MAG: ABC transporter ATP-binding protein [Clostridia bacterium]|nr:ABC transporter ATP-binding protein [Clostridia bacterium]